MYEVACRKEVRDDRELYLVSLSEQGAPRSDLLVLDANELESLIRSAKAVLEGRDDNHSLLNGDRFSFFANSSAYFILSVKVSEGLFKGYEFNLRGMKMLISELGSVLE